VIGRAISPFNTLRGGKYQTFADWFAELRELAGERCADVADQAPTVYAV
jgi:hypothetical protein